MKSKSVSRIVQTIRDGGSFEKETKRGGDEDINTWSHRTMLVTLLLLQLGHDLSKVVFHEEFDIIWPTLWHKVIEHKASEFVWGKVTKQIEKSKNPYNWIDLWKSEKVPEKRQRVWNKIKSLTLNFQHYDTILTYAISSEELTHASTELALIVIRETKE